MTHDGDDLLGTYLKDHFAGASAGAALAARIAEGHQGRPEAGELSRLAADVEEDRSLLREIMSTLGIEPSTTLDVAAEVGERLARLKPNGRVLERSPLSDLVELEAMRLGVAGKASCWTALRFLSASDARLSAPALDGLIARAESQIAVLERLWRASILTAFA
jgi:hypothetical protein